MTREQGVVASAAGLIPFGHLGWGYRCRTEFLARAAEYIADGLQQNQRVCYAGDGSRESLRAELATMPGIGEQLDAGAITVTPVRDFYALAPGAEIVDPQIAVTMPVAAVEKAIADGYTGSRAVVDATAVTRTQAQRAAFACFEFLIDQQMAVLPASALCAFDVSRLGQAAAELTCLHPLVNAEAPPFWLYGQPGSGFALAGEIDAGTDELFSTALKRIWPLLTVDQPLVVEVQCLEFITHRQLVTLDHYAHHDGREVVLRTGQRRDLARVVELLELTHVGVEAALSGV